MFDILSSLLKYACILLISFLIYISYIILLKPDLFRRKYSQYSNVKIGEKFVPLIGDFVEEMEVQKENKSYYSRRVERATEISKYDLKARLEFFNSVFFIINNRALEQFIALQKTSIDKLYINYGFSTMIPHGFGIQKTTPKTIQRRKNITSWLGLNGASKYIPHMISCCATVLDNMDLEKESDIQHSMNILTFDVFMDVIFGEDAGKLTSKDYPYVNPDGSLEDINLREMMIRLSQSYGLHYLNPLTYLLPFVAKYSLINPYKRDNKNLQVFRSEIKSIIDSSKDTSSVCYKFITNEALSREERMDDLLASILAGTETTSHSLVSALFFLNKHPEVLEKLRSELTTAGFTKEKFGENCSLENLQNLVYLNCVVKEVIRYDTAITDSMDYEATKDIQICGVPLPKGSRIKIDLVSNHHDEEKWLDPQKFIPERFDFDSEFFQKAKKFGKNGDIYSRRTFSHGNRSCPGQTFALLEMKVAISYFATHMNFQFKESDLNHEGIGFGVASQFNPKITVEKK